jgi:putative DNA primase/helicase
MVDPTSVSLRSVMKAEAIAKAFDGRDMGAYWMAACPEHDDTEPSLSVQDTPDGKVLVHCFAGCDQKRVIAALKSRGLWEQDSRRHRNFVRQQQPQSANGQPDRDDGKRTGVALSVWKLTKASCDTPVESYLRSRGLTIPPPSSLRFHDGLKHRSGNIWPAMVALVTRGTDDVPLGIHRTFLAHDGKDKAPVEPQKMMLGPCRGGVVRLAPAKDVLMVGEGIETCLAVMQATGLPAWAALSTSGLRSLDLPHEVRDIIVIADGDDPGEAASQNCGLRWKREGRRVRIARPPRGLDFNDLLQRHAPCVEGAAS